MLANSRAMPIPGTSVRIDPGLGVDAATVNREILRITPEPGARSHEAHPIFAELTGRLRVPVMAIHGTADFHVPFRLQQNYRRVEEAGTAHLLVAVRGTPARALWDRELGAPARL